MEITWSALRNRLRPSEYSGSSTLLNVDSNQAVLILIAVDKLRSQSYPAFECET
jgi:hypothetical protein